MLNITLDFYKTLFAGEPNMGAHLALDSGEESDKVRGEARFFF